MNYHKFQTVGDSPGESEEADSRRLKSTIEFPYGDLQTAIEVVTTIFKYNGQQHCSLHQLAAWLGHDSLTSGAFRFKYTTARIFGLIDVNHDEVKLTKLGCDIVDPNLERQARVEAFLHVPLYKALFDKHKGYTLPADIGLEQEIVGLGVTPKQKEKARQAFQRSAGQAGFFEQGRTKLVMPSGLGSISANNVPRDTRPLAPSPTPIISPSPQHSYSGGGGSGNGLPVLQEHPLIQGLFQLLPPIGTSWPENKRQEWLTLAGTIFKVLYSEDNQG